MTTVADGLYQFGGVPVGGAFTVGSTFFVDSATGNNSNDGKSIDQPVADLDYAIGLCTATNGDIIYLFPGHAETTYSIALDVAGVTIIGIGYGRARPTLTASAVAADLLNITAANCRIENVRFVGTSASCTALVDLSTAADDCQFINCSFEHGATPLKAITCNGDRAEWYKCKWLGTANAPDWSIYFESDCADFVVQDCIFNYGIYGLDDGAIGVAAAGTPASVCEGGLISRCQFIGMEATAVDFNSSSVANCGGMVEHCSIAFAAAAANVDTGLDLGSYGAVQNYATDTPTEGGGGCPATTAA